MPLEMNFVKLRPDAHAPVRGNPTDAGLDLGTPEAFSLKPLERKLIMTGIAAALPANTVGRILPRSKLANKFGIHVLGGVVDEGYTGDIGVILINLGQEEVTFKEGDKIAQYVVQPVLYPTPVEVTELEKTDRGAAGVMDKDLRL